MNTRWHSCDTTNGKKKSTCIKRFISNYIGCNPPWYHPEVKEKLDLCEGTLQEYIDIAWTLKNNATFRAETGCYKENCQQSTWKAKEEVELATHTYNVTIVTVRPISVSNIRKDLVFYFYLFTTPQSSFNFQDTIVKEEILQYDLLDFVAEFGGILGLLMGASILSAYDFFRESLQAVIGFVKGKCLATSIDSPLA